MTEEREGPAGRDGAVNHDDLTDIPDFLDRKPKSAKSQNSASSEEPEAPHPDGRNAPKGDPPRSPQLEAALAYAQRGWPVLPVHTVEEGRCSCCQPDCSSPGKHPRIKGGFKNATPKEEQIRAWWEKWPDANIGLATGFLPQLVVLDIDPRNGGDASLSQLEAEYGQLPHTLTVSSGSGGTQFYFAGGLLPCRANILPGIDFRGENGYIVAPPSFHASGGKYEVAIDAPLAALPIWLAELIRGPKAEGAQAHGARADKVSVDDLGASDRIKRLIREGDAEGEYSSRSEALFAVLRALVSIGWAYYKSDDLEEAESRFRQAVAANRSSYPAHLNLGIVLYDRNESVEAIREFEKVLELLNGRPPQLFAPAEAETRFRMAMAHIRLGQRGRALEQLRTAAKEGNETEWGQKSEEYLAVLE